MSLSPSRVYYKDTADTDFYLKKIERLEGDIKLLEDELSNTKIRLRRAEDFQLKFEVAKKQVIKIEFDNDSLLEEINKLTVLVDTLRVQNQKLASQSPRKQILKRSRYDESINQNLNDNQSNGFEDTQRLQTQIQSWKSKYQKLVKQNEQKSRYSKDKYQSQNFKTHDKATKGEDNRIQQLKLQVSKYKKLYEQKANMDTFVRQKTQRIKVEKDKQISRLNGINQTQYKEIEAKSKQSAAELIAIKNKYTSILNTQLEKIHKAMDDQDQIFDIEIKGLKKLIQLKDSQIQDMLKLMKSQSQKHMSQRQSLKQQINKLRAVLYDIQRQNQNQLYNMKQRLTSINADQITKLSKQYEDNKNSLLQQINNIKDLLSKKQLQCQSKVNQANRISKQLQQKVDQRDHKISQLLEKISHTGNQNMNQVKQINVSLTNIQTQKQQIVSGLNDNIAFKNNQIDKLTATIQVKNIQIKNLYQDVALLRKQIGEVQKQLETKWKQERKERELERDNLREQNETLETEWKTKQREWRLKQRSHLNDKQKLDRENLKLKLSRDDLEKVNADLTVKIKQIDTLYKNQIKKGHQASFDTEGIRRELMHQIQKQQIDLELAKKQQIQDMKKKHQIQQDRLRFQVSNLQTTLNTRNNQVQKLNVELKKLDSSSDKVLKGKFVDYQQKLAALNSQIYLTQNIYNSFIQAKSRIKKSTV